MSATIVPAKERVLVQTEDTSNPSSLLYIPEQMRDRCLTGTILAVGAGVTFQVGQRIILGVYTGVKMRVDNVEMLICKEDEIQGVVVGDSEILADQQ